MSDTALLVQDVQNGILQMVADESGQGEYLDKVAATIDAARAAGVKIFYVVAAFRPGHPEANPRNASIKRVADMNGFVEGTSATQIPSKISPKEGEVVITKRRVSAFFGTDLDICLRSAGVHKLALTGIATSGCVLSSIRHAADSDYEVTVLEDLCLDRDPETHKFLTEKIFTRQGTVESSQSWLSKLGSQ